MRDRLATESVEEGEARLQQMSTRQRERLATESAEEREARLQQIRDRLACVCAVAEISPYRRCALLANNMDPGPLPPQLQVGTANSSVMTGMRC